MQIYTKEELRERSFYRIAWVLWSFWEEQKNDPKREARVHSRLFDNLIDKHLILIGKSIKGGGHLEHLVPCALLRDRAFHILHQHGGDERSIKEVASMLGRFLRVAHITSQEANFIDNELGLKTTMPKDWNFDTGSVMARLDEGKVILELVPEYSYLNKNYDT